MDKRSEVTCWGNNEYLQARVPSDVGNILGNANFRSTSKPSIQGTAKVNLVLTASTGPWDSGVTFYYQWLRNGKPISRADSSKYRLTLADKKSRISVKVSVSKVGFIPVENTSSSVIVK